MITSKNKFVKFLGFHLQYLISKRCNSNIKNFKNIPGPKGTFNFGTIFSYLPIVGKYSWDLLHIAGFKKYEKYGPLVLEKMLPGVYVIWLFNPSDIATVLNDTSPGIYPQRKSHLALQKYRKDKPEMYRTGGLLPTNGLEWWKIRSELQKGLSSPQHIRNFLPLADHITCQLVDNLKSEHHDFLTEISRLNLELLCLLVFDVKMNSLSVEERLPNSRTSKLIESAETTNNCILPTDQGLQLWRLFNTPTYKKLKKSQEYMEKVAYDLVLEKLNTMKYEKEQNVNKNHKSLLEEYLNNSNLEFSDVIGMACDLLLAGVDTTSYATSFMLHHLAKNKNVQNKLFIETKKILPNLNDKITSAMVNTEIPYARAILKESLRLNPISVGVGRILNRDVILSGFNVPKGTIAVTQNLVACKLEENFSSPNDFIPERWLKSNQTEQKINPYLVLPFGHGMRSCIARRLAEQNMLLLIIRLIRKYEIDWIGSENLGITTKLINKPDKLIELKFKNRFK